MEPASNKFEAARRVMDAFDEAARTLAPLGHGKRLLLGCSAGGDSMALLDLAAGRALERGWALAVGHLDHAQRPESAEEAQFVAEQAARRGVMMFMERLNLPEAGAGALNEDALRRARHAAFRRFAEAWRADAIVLAHQADDQAETFLIRLLAGSGPTGLGGIRPVETIEGLTVARPLLAARRADLRDYLRAQNLPWRDDPSNEGGANKRGWVRNALLPAMRERIGLDPTARITRSAALIRAEAEVLEETIGLLLSQLALPPAPPALARLDLAHPLWREAGPLVRRQLLRQWLWLLRRQPHPPGYEALGEALAFVQAGRPLAELRTVERMHIVHCKTSLLAFAPEVACEARQAAAAPLLPERPPKRKRKKPVSDSGGGAQRL